MLYLIGGSPRSGKSTLAKKLSEILNVPYISTDVLRLVMTSSLSEDDKHLYFPFEKIFDLAGGVAQFFKVTSGQKMLETELAEAKTLKPGLEASIQHFLNSREDYIIEGVHFLPNFLSQYKSNSDIKTIILAKKDSEKIFQGLLRNRGSDDWISDNIKNEDDLASAAKSLSKYGEYFTNESKKFDLECINTEDEFLDKIKIALNHLK